MCFPANYENAALYENTNYEIRTFVYSQEIRLPAGLHADRYAGR